MLSTILGFISGALIAVFADPMRRWVYRPVLALSFDQSDHHITKTPEGDHEAFYVQVKAENSRAALARSYRAYRVNIERCGSSGAWEATTFCGSRQLAWEGPGNDPYSAVDIPRGVPLFFNVLSTREGSPAFSLSLATHLLAYHSFMFSPGTYRFTIAVSGDGVKPASIMISFTWTGIWNQFTVTKVA
jgi:hypothetical protein